VDGIGAGGWAIAQVAGQTIIIDSITGIAGANAAVISGRQYAAIELQYIGNNTFTVLNYTGNVGVLLTGGYVYEGGLTWMPVSTTYTQDPASGNPASTYCATTTINGLHGWRLPTQPELSALYSTFPNFSAALRAQGWTLNGTWSSTPAFAGAHYFVSFDLGGVYWGSDTFGYYVTCVR
jgi:hypothetical protein